MTNRDTLLVTGSAGHVARLVSLKLREHVRLRRLDLAEQQAEGDDEIVHADIRDTAAVEAACEGVVGLLHLAAHADEADFTSVLLPQNLVGTWSVFQAAVKAGVPRLIFASTGQTVGGNPAGASITPDLPPRPISVYACTKLFGEALGRYYADSGALAVACLRLGWVVPADSGLFATEPTLRGVWCGPDDLARLIVAALRSEEPFATVFAVSPPATARFDVTNPYGWAPQELPTRT